MKFDIILKLNATDSATTALKKHAADVFSRHWKTTNVFCETSFIRQCYYSFWTKNLDFLHFTFTYSFLYSVPSSPAAVKLFPVLLNFDKQRSGLFLNFNAMSYCKKTDTFFERIDLGKKSSAELFAQT